MKKFLTVILLVSFIHMNNAVFAEMVIKQDANGVYYVEESEEQSEPASVESKVENPYQANVQYDNQPIYQQDLEDEADYLYYEELARAEQKKSKLKAIGVGILAVGAIVGLVLCSNSNDKNKKK